MRLLRRCFFEIFKLFRVGFWERFFVDFLTCFWSIDKAIAKSGKEVCKKQGRACVLAATALVFVKIGKISRAYARIMCTKCKQCSKGHLFWDIFGIWKKKPLTFILLYATIKAQKHRPQTSYLFYFSYRRILWRCFFC